MLLLLYCNVNCSMQGAKLVWWFYETLKESCAPRTGLKQTENCENVKMINFLKDCSKKVRKRILLKEYLSSVAFFAK